MKLAIHGGKPAVTQDLPIWPPDDPKIRDSILSVLQNHTWGNYFGPALEELQARLCQRFQREFSWTCSSGTIAVELALRGLRIDSGEVILAGYDFPGNYRAIEAVGATPHLVDVVPSGFSIDVSKLQAALNENTRAIVFSHLHGELANAKELESFASDHQIFLIEDGCQCPGADSGLRPVGNFGDVSVFSFGGSKLLTAGRGGCVLTDDKNVWQRIKIYCERGNDAFPLSQLQAAALLPQLDSLDAKQATRFENLKRLANDVSNFQNMKFAVQEISSSTSFYKIPFWVGEEKAEFAVEALQAEGVPCGKGFHGFVRRAKTRRCVTSSDLVNSSRIAEKTVLLDHPFLLGNNNLVDQFVAAIGKVDQALSEIQV